MSRGVGKETQGDCPGIVRSGLFCTGTSPLFGDAQLSLIDGTTAQVDHSAMAQHTLRQKGSMWRSYAIDQ
jgi:hypothetical protein